MDIKKAREDLRKGKTIYDMPLKVVYYARVSTDKDDQLNSLENQQNYFEEMIAENKNWKFVRGYIDEGISGTAVKNRTQFLNMIEAASLGKIDLILTKEISRFSRNTVDSIKYTEYLLKQGTIVYFLSDNLNTIQEDAESPRVTSGIRLGSPAMTTRGLKEEDFEKIGTIISKALKNKDNETLLDELKQEVLDITNKYPIYSEV